MMCRLIKKFPDVVVATVHCCSDCGLAILVIVK
jgi:hypothetical protein